MGRDVEGLERQTLNSIERFEGLLSEFPFFFFGGGGGGGGGVGVPVQTRLRHSPMLPKPMQTIQALSVFEALPTG